MSSPVNPNSSNNNNNKIIRKPASTAHNINNNNNNNPTDGNHSSDSGTKKTVPVSKVPVGLAKGPDLKNVKSKIGSLNNVKHKPAGGDKKIESQKLTWNTNSRIGSLENASHKPHGGKVRVSTQKLEWKGKSKVGSLDNVTHKAGGGQVRIFDEKYTGSSSRATSTTRSGSTTPHVDSSTGLQHHQYNADDLLRQTEQKLTLND
ncbi:PREDICTED: microtubule-associated protein tau-like [Rhagoletis zephyria]|uniref:microtubule-associated protein tau-like n=1 Tax=Rhagoletis zephyria TaxID=28612 RepID=UPI0008117E47|nr:PREDICTED: microtubule-associated protein tau-like [Rhagoletis zephyria]